MCASLRQSACLCVVVLSTCASTLSTEAETIFVDASATGAAHDGSNWCNGYLNLQDALTAASFGDEVRVANGDYKPDQGETVTVGNRLASFKLRSGVAIRGGYAGCGASHPDARDTTLYETILSGDLAQNDAADFQIGQGACCLDDGSCQNLTEDACAMIAGSSFRGAGTSCLGDKDNSGKDDACDDLFLIPAVSDWGVVALTLLVLTSGTILIHRMRGTVVMPTL